ncbi:hypothetical protein ABEF95_003336 [Exophiala dermatitidis]
MSLTAANQRDRSVQDQALRSSGTETGDVDAAQRHGLQLPYVMQQDSLRTVGGSSNSRGRRRSSSSTNTTTSRLGCISSSSSSLASTIAV